MPQTYCAGSYLQKIQGINLKITQDLFDAYRSIDKVVGDMIFNIAYKNVKSYIEKITKYDFRAEEIVQEVFIDFWEHRESINTKEAFYSYLFSVIRSKTNDYFRNKSKEIVFSFEDVKDMDGLTTEIMPDPERFVISLENELMLEYILAKMPEQKQKVFTMYRIDGYSVAEISKLLNLSTRTVESHIYRVTKQLKNIFLSLYIALATNIFLS